MSESIERQKSEYVTLSTHVLNLGTGMPQRGLEVSLLNEDGDFMAKGITDRSGRISEWKDTTGLVPGTYRLRFLVGNDASIANHFYPYIEVVFRLSGEQPHYHLPLLLNEFGYTTYRGS